jgi:regulator of replication initiation timing
MYKNEDLARNMMDLFTNPLFRTGFAEFAQKAQQDGIEAAKKFWGLSDYGRAFPYSEEIYERLADFYRILGFVPSTKFNDVMEENNKLKAENQLLRNMIRDLQLNLFTEGGEKAQQLWRDIIDKQFKMNTEVASTFLEAIRQFKSSS